MEENDFTDRDSQDIDSIFEDRSTITNVEEVINKTESYKDLLEASKGLDEMDRITVILKVISDMESGILKTLQALSGGKEDFQQTYQFLIDKFYDEEQMKQNNRLKEVLGFQIGKDYKEEISDLARRQTVQLQSKYDQQWELLKEAQTQVLEVLDLMRKQLKPLLEGNEDKSDQRLLQAIREQLRDSNK